jgi:hypothetical protein
VVILDILIRISNNGQSADSGSVFGLLTMVPSNLSSFEREADGSIIQDPVYGGNKYGQTGRRLEV